jgi:hypothetical protein
MKFSIVAVTGLATASAFTPSGFMGSTSIRNAAQSTSSLDMKYKVAVIGGGPSGACAAEIFAQQENIETFLFERKMNNAKPCGGAIPLCMVGEFDIPETVVDRKVRILSLSSISPETVDPRSTVMCLCLAWRQTVVRYVGYCPSHCLNLIQLDRQTITSYSCIFQAVVFLYKLL